MGDDMRNLVERFLVEHVLLGLGNIRSTLCGLDGNGDHGLEVTLIAGQIDQLESRARALHFLLDETEAPASSAPDIAVFASRRGCCDIRLTGSAEPLTPMDGSDRPASLPGEGQAGSV